MSSLKGVPSRVHLCVAEGLNAIDGLMVDLANMETNIVSAMFKSLYVLLILIVMSVLHEFFFVLFCTAMSCASAVLIFVYVQLAGSS